MSQVSQPQEPSSLKSSKTYLISRVTLIAFEMGHFEEHYTETKGTFWTVPKGTVQNGTVQAIQSVWSL